MVGLALVQLPESDDKGNLTLTTVLLHKSGQYIGGSVPLKPVKQDPQGIGSAITYQRRYSAAAIAGEAATAAVVMAAVAEVIDATGPRKGSGF